MKAKRIDVTHLVLSVALVLTLASSGGAQEFKIGPLVIENPWTRATPGGAQVAGGYMTINNSGTVSDRLLGGSLPRAGRFEVHETEMQNGVTKMREVAGGLEIKPGQKIELKPGGYHVMFMDLREPFKQGEMLKGQLRFEKAGTVDVEYKVQAVGARAPGQ